MANKHVRAMAEKLVARLPELPQPWDVEELCQALGRARGRALKLHSADLPALPFGMWYDDGSTDHIIIRSSATGYYRDHIVLHEICHMLAGHGTALQEVLSGPGSSSGMDGRRAKGKSCNDAEEELAETFASLVLRIAGQMRPKGISAVERQAESLLGAGHA
ncbi:hypothetical protein [Streptomyces hesseae]|uniref:IrrE N-terminal-like domain-containing protein n=1 Tax=Streptomyces hesseae TaxID=3075519 RepID=A0ABU2SN82_9ACTN|nr:hypothetical protein [Streptomyces sp. DSM 40473]MDT0450352.1 hypothetical protein [Streptomyces sp. DSM 40473]